MNAQKYKDIAAGTEIGQVYDAIYRKYAEEWEETSQLLPLASGRVAEESELSKRLRAAELSRRLRMYHEMVWKFGVAMPSQPAQPAQLYWPSAVENAFDEWFEGVIAFELKNQCRI